MESPLQNTKLGLKLPTDPRWVNVAQMSIHEILIDHAYCEQKAASSCISLIIQFPDREKLVATLTPVVAEEWAHFERVMHELKKRGLPFGPKRKDEYVEKLYAASHKGGSKEQALAEKLLISALVEARSCERFRLLSKEIGDDGLRDFYRELMIAEASHYKNFLLLAKEYHNPALVEARWKELLVIEAQIMGSLAVRGDRMH